MAVFLVWHSALVTCKVKPSKGSLPRLESPPGLSLTRFHLLHLFHIHCVQLKQDDLVDICIQPANEWSGFIDFRLSKNKTKTFCYIPDDANNDSDVVIDLSQYLFSDVAITNSLLLFSKHKLHGRCYIPSELRLIYRSCLQKVSWRYW